MSIIYNAAPVRDGLVFHLDAGNKKSYPGTGTTWTDISTTGASATLTNGAVYSSSNAGVISFDGIDDYVPLPSIVTTTLNTTNWSYSGFVMTNNNTVTGAFLGPKNLTKGRCCIAATWAGAGNISFANEMVATVANTIMPLSNGVYLHICYTYGSGNLTTYKNGVLVGTTAYAFTGDCAGPYSLSGSNAGYVWNGNMGSFSVHNRTLSATEVMQQFNASRGRYGI
jgi:hypothetical protein